MENVRRGASVAAIPMLRRATEIDPSFALAWARIAELSTKVGALEDTTHALNVAKSLLRLSTVDSDEQLLIEAIVSFVDDNPDLSIASYRELLAKYPRDVTVLLGLSRSLRSVAKYEECERLARQAVDIDPGNILGSLERLQNLARIAPRRAIQILESEVASGKYDHDEARGRAYGLLGLSYARIAEPRNALPLYEKALEDSRRARHSSGTVGVLLDMADAYRESGRLDEAESTLTDVLSERPQGAIPLLRLGNLALELGEPARALELYRRALEQKLAGGFARTNYMDAIAEAYRLVGAYGDATVYVESALAQLNETDDRREYAYNRVLLGHIEMARGDYVQASQRFEDFLPKIWGNQSRDIALARQSLVTIYLDQGKFEDALEAASVPQLERNRLRVGNVTMAALRSRVLVSLGATEAAMRELVDSEPAAIQLQRSESQQFYLLSKGTLYRALDRHDESERALTAAIADSHERGYVLPWSEAMLELGRLRLDARQPMQAAKTFREVHAHAARFRHRAVRADASLGLAEALYANDELEDASVAATEARSLAREFDGKPIEARASRLLAQIATDRDDESVARKEHEIARAAYREIVATVPAAYVTSFVARPEWRCFSDGAMECR